MVWDARLDAHGQWRGQLLSSVWTQMGHSIPRNRMGVNRCTDISQTQHEAMRCECPVQSQQLSAQSSTALIPIPKTWCGTLGKAGLVRRAWESSTFWDGTLPWWALQRATDHRGGRYCRNVGDREGAACTEAWIRRLPTRLLCQVHVARQRVEEMSMSWSALGQW